MIGKLLQLVLIWLAASAVIVLGVTWGYLIGFTTHKTHLRIIGVIVASLACVFGAALVQRSPAATVALVLCSAALFAFGGWLTAGDAPVAGFAYMATGATYLVSLGPSCTRWFKGDNER